MILKFASSNEWKNCAVLRGDWCLSRPSDAIPRGFWW